MSTDIRTALAELLGAAKECSRTRASPGLQWIKLVVAMQHAEVALAAPPAAPATQRADEPVACDCTNPWAHDQCTEAPGCKVLAKLSRAAPAYVPLSDEEVEKLGHRECWRYAHSTDPAHSSTYKFNLMCLLDFAKSIESLVVARMRNSRVTK